MSRKKIVDEKISEALDIDFEVEESLIEVQKSPKPIVVKREGLTDTDRDYETVRNLLMWVEMLLMVLLKWLQKVIPLEHMK